MEALVLGDEPVAVTEPKDLRTLADLRRNGYTKLTPELVKDILYLEQLASSTSRRIDDWQAIEMLAPLPRGDKRAINKLFFSQADTVKEITGEVDKETFERIQRCLFDVAEKRRQSDIEKARYNYNSRVSHLQDHHRRLQKLLKEISVDFDHIQTLEGLTPASCMSEFEQCLKNPFFTFERFAFNKAYFVTTNPVLMNQKNLTLGINRTVDFGKIRFSLDFSNAHLEAFKHENNLVLPSGHWHPFISNCGTNVCFGEQGDVAYKYLVQREYGKLFELLASLLTTYSNAASPYVSFGTFVDYEANGKAKRMTPQLCPDCKVVEDRCECERCVNCLERGHSSSDCTTHCHDCGNSNEDCRCGQNYCDRCEHYDGECGCDESDCAECANR